MAARAKDALSFAEIDVIADKGYLRGPDLLTCRDMGINALVPKPDTCNTRADGRYGKEGFLYLPEDAYRCPAGQLLRGRCETMEGGLTVSVYWTATCPACPLKTHCTTGKERRVVRHWEHEGVVEALAAPMEAMDDAMAIRRETVQHPFATIKAWMGATHFLCKGLKAVRTR